MKNHFIPAMLMMATALSFSSCNKNQPGCDYGVPATEPGYGELSLNVDLPGLTKASDISSHGNEARVNDVQLLVFDASGNVVAYVNSGTSLTSSLKLKTGTYSCRAVVNGPDAAMVKTSSALDGLSVDLAAYNDVDSDFLMCGETQNVTVMKNASSSCSITVSRFVSRVKLVSIVNECPAALGSITLKRAFLSNVVGNQNLSGQQAPSVFTNMYGRSEVSSKASIIDGSSYQAVPSGLTYANLNSASLGHGVSLGINDWFYSYPNSYTDVVKAWKSSWTPTATRLVLVAAIGGNDYYYPVAIPQSTANTSYDVSMTITGEGLDDPQDDPATLSDKGSLKVSVTVADWAGGTEYVVEY